MLILHVFDEMSLTEIATHLHIPRGTAARRLRRARIQFRKHVAAAVGYRDGMA